VIREVALAAAMLVALTACGGSSTAGGSNLADVAVQTRDMPAGMVRCDLSGDIASFTAKEKAADQVTYATVKSDWDAAQKNGAAAAYIALYTDTTAHCAELKTTGGNPAAATYKLVVNFVIQFKDEATAAAVYSTGTFFHYSVADLRSGGQTVIEGTATGLTSNSIVRNAYLASQTWFIALWQNGAFLVVLAILNFDPASSQKAAVAENSRIK
jgi:hypothetical protein